MKNWFPKTCSADFTTRSTPTVAARWKDDQTGAGVGNLPAGDRRNSGDTAYRAAFFFDNYARQILRRCRLSRNRRLATMISPYRLQRSTKCEPMKPAPPVTKICFAFFIARQPRQLQRVFGGSLNFQSTSPRQDSTNIRLRSKSPDVLFQVKMPRKRARRTPRSSSPIARSNALCNFTASCKFENQRRVPKVISARGEKPCWSEVERYLRSRCAASASASPDRL